MQLKLGSQYKMKNLNTRSKLFLISSIPLVGILLISILYTKDLYKNYIAQKNIFTLTSFYILSGNLIHELQKERGLSAGFISSKGIEYKDKLEPQREKANQALLQIETSIKEDFKNSELNSIIDSSFFLGISQELNLFRKKVNSLEVTTKEQIPFYSKMIGRVIQTILKGTNFAEDINLSKMLASYYKLVTIKENAGIERATINAVLSKKEFDNSSYETWIRLKANQDICIKEFNQIASDDLLKLFNDKLNDDALKKFNEFRSIVNETKFNNQFDLEPKSWWEESTKRIDLLKEIETKIAEKISIESKKETKDSLFKIIIFCTINLIIFFI